MNKYTKVLIDKSERINEIRSIVEKQKPVATGVKLPIDTPGLNGKVYRIPLNLLMFNHLNDRFASKRLELLENTGEDLKGDHQESQDIIFDFIWNSSVKSNEETLNNILKNKQQKFGVITNDGRVIDGNRRVAILKKIYYSEEGTYKNINRDNFKYFEAVILSDDIDDEEIQILETKLQMGEDEKVDYNPIEKYIKIDKLYRLNKDYKEIASLINSIKNEKEAEEMHNRFKLMEEYLNYIDEKNRFSFIYKMEDHFIKLEKTIKYYTDGKYVVDWNPNDDDISELKSVAFNYIRVGYEGKDFRNIMGGQRDKKGVFSNKSTWDKFKNKHFAHTDNLDKQIQKKVNNKEFQNSEEKEIFYKQESKNKFQSNLARAKEALDNYARSNEPLKLVEEAIDKIDAIDVEYYIENYNKETYNNLKKLRDRVSEIIQRVIDDVHK